MRKRIKKKHVGKPKNEDSKNSKITVRFTEEAFNYLKNEAEENKLTLAELVRARCQTEYDKQRIKDILTRYQISYDLPMLIYLEEILNQIKWHCFQELSAQYVIPGAFPRTFEKEKKGCANES